MKFKFTWESKCQRPELSARLRRFSNLPLAPLILPNVDAAFPSKHQNHKRVREISDAFVSILLASHPC